MPRLYVLTLALSLLAPMTARAWMKPNLKYGPLELHPYYKLTETYDSNIYMVPEDQASGARVGGGVLGSWITDNNLGVGFKLPLSGMHNLEGGYDFQSLLYTKQPKANNAVNQKVNATYGYQGPMGISGRAWDSYANTQDPAFSESAARERRWQNNLGVYAEYSPEGGNFFGGLTGEHVVHKYLNPSLGSNLNRYEQTFGLKGGYKLAPKTRAYLGWRRQAVVYTVRPSIKNNKTHFLDFGVEGQLMPKLTGMVQTGVSLRDYDDGNTGITGYTRNWVLSTQLAYKPEERCQFTLSASRGLNEATFSNNRFYISNSVGLGAKHQFPWKVTGMVDLSVAVDRYPESSTVGSFKANRRDDIYQQRLAADYDLQDYLKLGASYMHRQKFSNFSGQFNYDDHQFGLSAKLLF